MNYRHHYHAGNFADVVKHVLLVQLVRALQQKPKGFLFLDTHAGRGAYDLEAAATGETLAREPEWPGGIGRIAAAAQPNQAIDAYLKVVQQFDRSRGHSGSVVRFYPGSPAIVRALARPQDRLVVCEKHPEELEALQREFASGRLPADGGTVSVQGLDGYVALRALLPPAERRGLILIDPPYEAQDEFAQAIAGVAEGLRRFPSGVFALWYPLTQRARVQQFLSGLEALKPPPTLVSELMIAGDDSSRKMRGCGLAVVNPPWKFDAAAEAAVAQLSPLLAQEPGNGYRVAWLVPEQ